MKISAVIPVYNAEKYLDRLLTSIQQQTYNNYEVIIVNDGSTDNSLQVINKYKNLKMRCITIENSGPGVARKEGFKIATGDLLFFIDSDDFLPSKFVFEKINKIYQENKFDILFFCCKIKINEKEVVRAPIKGKNKEKLEDGMYNSEYLKNHTIWSGLWSKVFVREKMTVDNFCNSNNFEDAYTLYTYLNNCNNFYFTNEAFYYSDRDVSNSLSKRIDTNKIFRTVENLEEIYKKTNYKLILSKVIYDYYIFTRKMIDKSKTNAENKEEKIKQVNKVKELKKLYKGRDLFKIFYSLKEVIKYYYFKMEGY